MAPAALPDPAFAAADAAVRDAAFVGAVASTFAFRAGAAPTTFALLADAFGETTLAEDLPDAGFAVTFAADAAFVAAFVGGEAAARDPPRAEGEALAAVAFGADALPVAEAERGDAFGLALLGSDFAMANPWGCLALSRLDK